MKGPLVTTISRMQVRITGGTIGEGIATHYWATETSGVQALLKTFWISCGSLMGGWVTIRVPNSGETFDVATGTLNGTWSEGTVSTATGGGSGGSAGGVGACVGWSTDGIRRGRKVRGRTFLVPLAANVYDSDGTLLSTTVTTLNGAVTTLLGAGASTLQVYARPTPAPGGIGPDTPGQVARITSGLVKDHVSWLRSRR
jgi:hypothetical protein